MRFRNELSSLAEVSLYSEGMFVALGIQHVMRMRHIVLCCTLFFHNYLMKSMIFEKKKLRNINICFDFLYSFVWNVIQYRKNWAKYD